MSERVKKRIAHISNPAVSSYRKAKAKDWREFRKSIRLGKKMARAISAAVFG